MKYILTLLAFLIVTGCTGKFSVYDSVWLYASSLEYALMDDNGWRIITPRKGEWRLETGEPWKGPDYTPPLSGAYLPEYFPAKDTASLSTRTHMQNFVYALHPLAPGKELALWIRFEGILDTEKRIYRNFFGMEIGEQITIDTKRCGEKQTVPVVVAFNAAPVDFDSASLYFIINGEPRKGMLMSGTQGWATVNTVLWPHDVFRLDSPEVIRRMQPRATRMYAYPTFHYKFHMNCEEAENAEFVIDGLIYQGTRLPPLKIRLRHMDFSKVPRYAGPPAGKER